MSDGSAIALLVVIGLTALVGGPILALLAWVKVRDLERRVNELNQRLAAPRGASTVPSTGATEPAPRVDVKSAPAGPVPAPPPTRAARRGADLERLIAGRWLNRIGLLAVAVGVAFFLKAAIDNDWIGPAGQVALGLLLGAGLIASTSWFLKHEYRYFADGLTGLGAAVLYLSLWAASSYYRLVPPTGAFVAMAVVTGLVLAIALNRDSQRVAALAMIGGFLTPALVSTGQNAEFALFSYLALQNAVLLVVAQQRDWRLLEVPALVFTEMYFWAWYGRYYAAPAMAQTWLFATLFYVEFAVLPVIRSRRQGAFRAEHGVVMLLNVAAYLGVLQAMMWPDQRWLLTVSTLALAAFHLLVVQAVPADRPLPRLVIGGLALTLVTLAIPMRLSNRSTAIAWAVEAAVLMWIGFRLRTWQVRAAAFALFAIVGLIVLSWPENYTLTLWNARFVVMMATAACAFAAVWMAHAHADAVRGGEPAAFGVLAVAAHALTVWSLTEEIGVWYLLQPSSGLTADTRHAQGLTVSLFWTLYATALLGVGVKAPSALLRWLGLALFGVTTLKVFLYDLADLAGFYRILSAIALGVMLLIVSFFYQRRWSAGQKESGS
jgi:uncharacterized membrane protein